MPTSPRPPPAPASRSRRCRPAGPRGGAAPPPAPRRSRPHRRRFPGRHAAPQDEVTAFDSAS
ncbi:MAG: hypothetical protein E6J84_14300 [Deltaproteobacteria bacterium]|nr:MAG: hypothetical protein E6J84_14300 [Deltaproteobacteria bacterium]